MILKYSIFILGKLSRLTGVYNMCSIQFKYQTCFYLF
jgi:hypothetical protein